MRAFVSFAAAVSLIAIGACASDPVAAPISPLSGMSQSSSNDTVVTPPNPSQPTPGSFHGNIIGRGPGTDTIGTGVKIAGAKITVYPFLGYEGNEPKLGAAVAEFTSASDGTFQSPQIAGGNYAVTFVPPASSAYKGTWVTTTVHQHLNDGTWWIVLQPK